MAVNEQITSIQYIPVKSHNYNTSWIDNAYQPGDNEIMTLLTPRQKGFSLLELLVVISIIGILIAVSAVGFSAAQQRSRDAKRRGDLTAWKNALEQEYAEQTDYDGLNNGCNEAVTNHMNGITPADPKGDVSYTATCATDTYCICALMELESSGNSNDELCDYDNSGDENYYCVSNLQ